MFSVTQRRCEHSRAYQRRHRIAGIIGLAKRGPMSGGNQLVAGAQARALGNRADASVPTAGQYPPRSAARNASERCAERSARIVP